MFVIKLFGLFSLVLCEKRLYVDQLRWEFLQLENHLWNMSWNGLLYQEQAKSESYLIAQFHQFDQKIKRMPEEILPGLEPIGQIPNFYFFYSMLTDIDRKYDKFREYQNSQIAQLNCPVRMRDIIYDILNNKTGVQRSIDQVFERQRAIGKQFVEMTNERNFLCKNYRVSPQQLIYNLYNVISLRELKAYIMQQFAYLGNRLWEKGDNAELSTLTRKNFEQKANLKITQYKNDLKTTVDIWRCDPKDYVEGKTYVQFTRLLQGYIKNEVDLDSTCQGACSQYSSVPSFEIDDNRSAFSKKVEKCAGRIIGCQSADSHATFCVSSNSSPRRYDYVKYESEKILGRLQYCSTQKSVSNWKVWFVSWNIYETCDYCMCLCDEQGPLSDRFINLRPVIADTKNNRVVTGLRLIKHNRLLHLQIQEGELLPYGYINQSTVHWVPVDDYKITDADVYPGEDHTIMKSDNRSMAVDAIQVNQDNHVVTGVRFEFITDKVYFEIHVSPFDWLNGTIQDNHGYYINEASKKRSRINLANADVPVKTNKPSTMNFSDNNYYVEFTHTDFNSDVAQTTIPFIDTQEVTNTPAVPLMGAGIYYKGTAGFGGFIGARIKTYNYTEHYTSLFPKMEDRLDIWGEYPVEVN